MDTEDRGGVAASNQEIFSQRGSGLVPVEVPEIAWALQERDSKGADSSTKDGHLIPMAVLGAAVDIAPCLTGNYGKQPDNSDTAKGPCLVLHGTQDPCIQEDNAFALGRNNGQENAVCYPINTQIALRHEKLGRGTGFGIADNGDPAFTLQANHHHAVAAFKAGQGSKAGGIGYDENVAPTLGAADSGTQQAPTVLVHMAVRRLLPEECEILQGFEPGFTRIPWRGKAPEDCPDGPRYKSIGNSWATNCAKWIFHRIDAFIND